MTAALYCARTLHRPLSKPIAWCPPKKKGRQATAVAWWVELPSRAPRPSAPTPFDEGVGECKARDRKVAIFSLHRGSCSCGGERSRRWWRWCRPWGWVVMERVKFGGCFGLVGRWRGVKQVVVLVMIAIDGEKRLCSLSSFHRGKSDVCLFCT